MKKIKIILLLTFYLCFQHNVLSQSIAINNTGVIADTTAILDITSTDKGLLIPRLTTVQRDAIVNPAQSLLIYNTTTQCYEFWENNMWQSLACACTKPAAAGPISGNINVCQGSSSEVYSIAPVSDATSYVWQYSGTGFSIVAGSGTNSITAAFSSIATAGNLTVYGTNTCGNGTAQLISITVTAPPTTADAGTDINPACGISTATLAGNTPTVGTGTWSVVSGTATITTPSSPTSGITGLTVPGTATLRWTISNAPCADAYDEVVITVTAPPTTADAGTDISPVCGISTATLAGNTPTVGTGTWSVVSGTATITTPSSPTSGVTGLTVPGTATLRWTISNPPCTGSYDEVMITTTACGPSCGSQEWMAANMNVGTRVLTQNNDAQVEKSCYNDLEANCDIYGGLYFWTEAMQIPYSYNSADYPTNYTCDPCGSSGRQGICPAGYHIPTDLEWSRYEWCIETTIAPTGSTTLNTFQTTTTPRGSTTAGVGPGDKMKLTSSDSPAWNGTNTSGFSAMPGGVMDMYGTTAGMGFWTYFWSATESGVYNAWDRQLFSSEVRSARNSMPKYQWDSVRCLKD